MALCSELLRQEVMVALVGVTGARVFESLFASQLQSFLQVFGHEFILKDTVKDTEKRNLLFEKTKTILSLQVGNFFFSIRYLDGFIVQDAGELL